MPDITDLVLDDHELFRRRFAELDDMRAAADEASELGGLWESLAGELERHASAEEKLFYPRLLKAGENAEEETEDAISDHNDIREAIRASKDKSPGSTEWWEAVLSAREANSTHMAEEERESFPDFRQHVDPESRRQLGEEWLAFSEEHAGGRGLSLDEPDPEQYIEEHE